jgi:hypothetical protein
MLGYSSLKAGLFSKASLLINNPSASDNNFDDFSSLASLLFDFCWLPLYLTFELSLSSMLNDSLIFELFAFCFDDLRGGGSHFDVNFCGGLPEKDGDLQRGWPMFSIIFNWHEEMPLDIDINQCFSI